MFSVDLLLVTMLVASNTGMLFPPVRICLTYSFKTYFQDMRTCNAKVRYFDWDGQVHLAKGKTGGQQGDPLEMLIFNLTIHQLWGRVLAKLQEARSIAYAHDGYTKAKLSVALQVLAELKYVLKQDAGLELNVSKTSILPKGVTNQAPHPLMWRRTSYKLPPRCLTSAGTFSSPLSVLTVSLVSVCLLVLMLLYGTL
jgi:hypothetical protein